MCENSWLALSSCVCVTLVGTEVGCLMVASVSTLVCGWRRHGLEFQATRKKWSQSIVICRCLQLHLWCVTVSLMCKVHKWICDFCYVYFEGKKKKKMKKEKAWNISVIGAEEKSTPLVRNFLSRAQVMLAEGFSAMAQLYSLRSYQ